MAIPIINGTNVQRAINQLTLLDLSSKVQISNDGVPLTIKSRFANGIDLEVCNDANFRAPYINLRKARGTEESKTPVTRTGYELDSLGGILCSGWSGSVNGWVQSCGLVSQVDENWTDTRHGSHMVMYGTSVGGNGTTSRNVLMQWGGLDPAGLTTGSGLDQRNISHLWLSFYANTNVNAMIKPVNSPGGGVPPKISIRAADDSADGDFSCGAASFSKEYDSLVKLKTYTVGTLPSASSNAGWEAQVTDSSVTSYRGTVSGGGSNRVRVFSNGTNWLVN